MKSLHNMLSAICPMPLATILLIFIFTISAKAQQNSTLLIAVPRGIDLIQQDVLRDFEAANPGIQVQVAAINPDLLFPDPFGDPVAYAEDLQTLVQQADVLYVNDWIMFAAALSGGYFIDLSPLTDVDPRFAPGIFHPATTHAFRDDRGALWGLAGAINVSALLYDPGSLQNANLNSPTASWTMDDYQQAAASLYHPDDQAGLLISQPGALIRGLWNAALFDRESDRIIPQLSHEILADLVEGFRTLESGGLLDSSARRSISSYPLFLGSITVVADQARVLHAAPLPENTSDVVAWGFGVSAGTARPDLAYELAAHLTQQIDLTRRAGGSLPTATDRLTTTTAGFPDSAQHIIQTAMETPPSLTERFFIQALNQLAAARGVTADALEAMEAHVLELADTLRRAAQEQPLVIATPVPPAPAEGVTLRFGVSNQITNIYPDEWRRVSEAFSASDPVVDNIVLISPEIHNSLPLLAEQTDCFYLPGSGTDVSLWGAELDLILPLSPLTDADPTFEPGDLIGANLLDPGQRDLTWHLPITLMPDVLSFDRSRFEDMGITSPAFGWPVAEFEMTLRQLQPETEEGPAPLFLPAYGFILQPTPHVLMLIAAYGGLPFDYRTTPFTVDFTSPEVVEAISIVLDLARAGLIDYEPQSPGNLPRMGGRPASPIAPVSFGEVLDASLLRAGEDWLAFPSGRYTPVSFQTGSGYISSRATQPEACYRWLRTLSHNPHLFLGLPAYRSLIDDVDPVNTRGIVFMRDYIDLVSADNAVRIHDVPWHFAERLMLFRAFDNYVLEESDLITELQLAETRVREFRACTDNITPAEIGVHEDRQRVGIEHARCAVIAYPDIETLIGGLLE